MSQCRLDHLVVVAADLDGGQDYIEELLGVETVLGGKHHEMGTHNRLLRLGEDQYLEIIAIDPCGNAPERPRWFGMDGAATHSRVGEVPRLAAWVARTADIGWAAERPPYDAMSVREMSRDDLRWQMTFTSDGSLPLEGALPLLIEWKTQPMPPLRLPDSGCALKRLVVQSPQDQRVRRVLYELGLDGVDVDHSVQTGLTATLTTPGGGEVVLSEATAREPGSGL